jgi:ParB-like nuclease family protein
MTKKRADSKFTKNSPGKPGLIFENFEKPKQLSLRSLRPSPENSKLYRKVRATDPDIVDLRNSIRKNGILEPLRVTKDYYIISGHRRFAAAKHSGLGKIPCIIADFKKADDHDRFMRELREANRQRVKTVVEVLREEIITLSPEDAHQQLLDDRNKRQECEDVEVLDLGKTKDRSQFSEAKMEMVNTIERIVDEMSDYWPLSDRLIHYKLLNEKVRRNTDSGLGYTNSDRSYQDLTGVLTRMRIQGIIPMDSIADATRPCTTWKVYQSPQQFIREQIKSFMSGYCRDMMVSQPYHIEVIAEKLTVEPIIRPVVRDFRIPLTITRGQSSIPSRYEVFKRFKQSGKDRLALIIVSDFDADGESIARSFPRSLRDDFNIHESNIIPVRAALTKEQVDQLDIFDSGQLPKKSSTNYQPFVKKYGESQKCYELEAVSVETLQEMVRDSIESVIDFELFDKEQKVERQDSLEIDNARQRINLAFGDYMNP